MKVNKMSTQTNAKKSLKDFQVRANRTEHKFTQARELKEKEDSEGSIYQKGYYPSVYNAKSRSHQGGTEVRVSLNYDDYTILKHKANEAGTTIGKLLVNAFLERPLDKGASKNAYADYTEEEEQEMLSQLQSKYNQN